MTKRIVRVHPCNVQSTHRTRYLAVLLGSLALACSKTNVVVPASGGTQGKARLGGLTMYAEPNSWSWDPSDLPEYMTPIWIYLVNRRNDDIRVVYADFSLTDSAGTRYAAISPYPTYLQSTLKASPRQPSVDLSEVDPAERVSQLPDGLAGSRPVEWWLNTPFYGVASDGNAVCAPVAIDADFDGEAKVVLIRGVRLGGHAGGHFGGHADGRGAGRFQGNRGHSGAGYRGTYVGGHSYDHPYYSGYYPLYTPWPYLYANPPVYGPFVNVWGDRNYPAAPSEDVVRYGLPEGVLHAGGTVAGFVYFQNATAQTSRLDMTWTVRTKDGIHLGKLAIPLLVEED